MILKKSAVALILLSLPLSAAHAGDDCKKDPSKCDPKPPAVEIMRGEGFLGAGTLTGPDKKIRGMINGGITSTLLSANPDDHGMILDSQGGFDIMAARGNNASLLHAAGRVGIGYQGRRDSDLNLAPAVLGEVNMHGDQGGMLATTTGLEVGVSPALVAGSGAEQSLLIVGPYVDLGVGDASTGNGISVRTVNKGLRGTFAMKRLLLRYENGKRSYTASGLSANETYSLARAELSNKKGQSIFASFTRRTLKDIPPTDGSGSGTQKALSLGIASKLGK